MPRGRRTKLTPERQADFVKAVEAGGTYKMAAARIGVHETTIQAWMKKGREAESGVYREFHLAAQVATDKCGLRWLAEIETLAKQKQDWKAYAWLLERRFPQDFARLSDRPAMELDVEEAESLAVRLLSALREGGEE